MSTGMTVRKEDAIAMRGSTVGEMSEIQRATAEIQSALTVAAARPRDEVQCIDRIITMCQRKGLAANARYVYSRGGTDIQGPTIDLLTAIANCWGNIQFGFREVSRREGVSEVEAFAWDLQTNSKRTVVFSVPHVRDTKNGSYRLTDNRDIYETISNQAQRRVRSCLEAVIPSDVVDVAADECEKTLKQDAVVTPESIKALVDAFAAFGVTKQQIEKRIGRHASDMQPAQLVKMRMIYKSIKEGMSSPSEWFEPTEDDATKSGTEAAVAAIKKQPKKQKQSTDEPPQPPAEQPKRTAEPEPFDPTVDNEPIDAEYEVTKEPAASDEQSESFKQFMAMFQKCKNVADFERLAKHAVVNKKCGLNEAEIEDADRMLSASIDQLKGAAN